MDTYVDKGSLQLEEYKILKKKAKFYSIVWQTILVAMVVASSVSLFIGNFSILLGVLPFLALVIVAGVGHSNNLTMAGNLYKELK